MDKGFITTLVIYTVEHVLLSVTFMDKFSSESLEIYGKGRL